MTKNNNIFSKPTLLYLTILLLSIKSFGQNSFKFIEPNISFSYDSTKLKITNRYSNKTYETESYDFKTTFDTLNKVEINIRANHPIDHSSSSLEQEKIMNNGIKEIQKMKDSRISLVDYDKTAKRIGNFFCFGFTVLEKKTKTTFTNIFCIHISDADITEVKLTSIKRQSLAADYKILENFLKGFSSYSKEKIFIEDSLIKNKYTVSVVETKETIENLKWRNNSYFAIVKTNQPLQNKVKEVRLDIAGYGQEIFPANDNGEVYIACTDWQKGLIERKGEFVIINSFGKNVKIPFTFKYNKK